MKMCRNCGAVQGDDRTICVDCGSVLDKPVGEGAEKLLNKELGESIERGINRSEDFYVTALDKILGIVSLISMVFMIISLVVYSKTVNETQSPISGETYVSEGDQAVVIVQSATDNQMNTSLILVSIVFFFVVSIIALMPKAVWLIDSIPMRLWSANPPTPSTLYFIVLKMMKYVLFVLAIPELIHMIIYWIGVL